MYLQAFFIAYLSCLLVGTVGKNGKNGNISYQSATKWNYQSQEQDQSWNSYQIC